MIELSILQAFKLTENPFSVTPSDVPRTVVWAGRQELKDTLTTIIRASIISSPSRLNVNWGEWGAGKTHAMRYFSQANILSELSDDISDRPVLSIRLTCPREAVFESLYISFLNEIGLNDIRDSIRLITQVDRIAATETRIHQLDQLGISNIAAKLFIRLTSSNSSIQAAAERYMYLESTSADIRKLQVPRRIRTKMEVMNMFSDVMQLLLTKYARLFVWIDEMETIETLSGRDLSDIRFFLRSCLDFIPRNFTLFINATKKAEELNSYLSYLGEAVQERIYRVTELPTLRESDAVDYVRLLLNSSVYRTEEDTQLLEARSNPFFPFEEESIVNIYQLLIRRLLREPTPRNINDALSSTLEYAMQNAVMLEGLANFERTIDTSYISENWELIGMGIHLTE